MDRARSTVLINCDAFVPTQVSGEDHILVRWGSDVTVMGGRLQHVVDNAPAFGFLAVKESPEGPPRGRWNSGLGLGAEFRLPRYRAADPNLAELTTSQPPPGSVRFNADLDALEVLTTTGWRQVVMTDP